MTSKKELGERIRDARIAARYSVVAAAERAGIARDTWNKIEAGESVLDTKRQAALDLLDLDDDGRPRSVGTPGQADRQYVSSSVSEWVEGGKRDDEVLRAITAMSATLDQLVAGDRDRSRRDSERDTRVDARFEALEASQRELSQRMAQLEEPGT